MQRRLSLQATIGALLLIIGACSDSPAPTGLSPDMAISDAVHNDGNEHFYFLPPMVKPAPTFSGVFDPDEEPIVEICVWDGTECSVALELYTTGAGPAGETVRVDPDAEVYQVLWKMGNILDNVPIDEEAGESYRIRVLIGNQELGYADVQVVESGRYLKNVDTDEYVAQLDGTPLAITFRIEEGWEEAGAGEQLSAGYFATCAVDEAGTAYCWGSNRYGQLGIGTLGGYSSTPVPVAGGHTFQSVTAGANHACGVTTDGDAYCWGYRQFGQVGDGILSQAQRYQLTPSLVVGGHTFESISAGYFSTCAVTVESDVYCWGYNGNAQLGNGTRSYVHPSPGLVIGGRSFASVSVGTQHVCGLSTTDQAYCWGLNLWGQIGDGTSYYTHGVRHRYGPTQVPGNTFVSVDAGWFHSCGVATDGVGYCWGYNAFGQLGRGTVSTPPHAVPTVAPISGGHALQAISAGSQLSCALGVDGSAYCWGNNNAGGVGDGTISGLRPSPRLVIGGHTFSAVSAGHRAACGVTTGGTALCWGFNNYGQVGDGSLTNATSPTPVVDLDPNP